MPTDDHDKKLTKLIWRGLIIALMLGVAAGILIGLLANSHASRVANCVNTALGERNRITARDAQAHIDDARAFKRLLHDLAIPAETDAQKLRAYEVYVHKQGQYVRALIADQNYRDAHPLGRC